MTLDTLMTYASYALPVLQAALLVGMLYLRSEFVPRKTFAAFADDLSRRVAAVETGQKALAKDVEALPTTSELVQLSLQLKEIEGQQKTLTATMEGLSQNLAGVQTQLGMIMQHLLDGDRK